MPRALWYKEICTVLTVRSYLVLCFDSLNPDELFAGFERLHSQRSCSVVSSSLDHTDHTGRRRGERTVDLCCSVMTTRRNRRRCCFTSPTSVWLLCLHCGDRNGDIISVRDAGKYPGTLLIPKSYQVFNPAMALFIHLVDTPVTNQDFNILNYMYVLFYTCGGKLFLKMKQ